MTTSPLSISLVERETGVGKDTLRVWERRYGFPDPARNVHGDRVYTQEQVERLRLVKQLLDRGYRASKVVPAPYARLSLLFNESAIALKANEAVQPDSVIDTLQQADLVSLRALLQRELMQRGILQFVKRFLAPLNTAVGLAWAEGRLTVHQEHLYTESVKRLLRANLLNIALNPQGPRLLLTTLPGEQHGLGLLMVETLVAVHGGVPINLGTEVPVSELSVAARAHQSRAVALSFSQARSTQFVTQGIHAVRQLLPDSIALWIGGAGANRLRDLPIGVKRLDTLDNVQAELNALQATPAQDAPVTQPLTGVTL